MYNQAQKESFIGQHTEYSSTDRVVRVLFGKTERYERKWGCDIAEKCVDADLYMALDDALGVKTASKRTMFAILQSYVRWCIANKIPNTNTLLLELSIDCVGIEKVKMLYIANPTHLENKLNKLFPPAPPELSETSSILYRCFCWMAYAGIKEDDILNVRRSDVDLRSMVVRVNNEEYPIYREGVSAIDGCVNINSFVVMFTGRAVRMDRVPSDIVMRGVKSIPTLRSIRVELSRSVAKHIEKTGEEIRLSYSRIWLSGVFYRMYERECAGFLVDFSDVILDKVGYSEGESRDDRSKVLTKYRRVRSEMQRDYENWKKAFHS